PLLSVQLNPTRYLPSMTISWSWPLTPARIVEQEVTTVLEGIMSTVSGVKSVRSTTADGSGSIRLEFDKSVDLGFKKFEVSSLLREVRGKLPERVSYPSLSVNMPDNQTGSQILAYQVNGNASAAYIQQFAEENIKPRIALTEGVYQVNVYGASPFEWEIIYDDNILTNTGITTTDIQSAIRNFMTERELGGAIEDGPGGIPRRTYLSLHGNNSDTVVWENIPVKRSGSRIVRLGDISTIRLKEQKATSFYRINGLNTVNITVSAERNVNHIKVAAEVRAEVESIIAALPAGYSMRKSYDSTVEIKKEINKIVYRTIFSVVLLLLFVFIISRQVRYLMVISVSLVANIAIAFIFYYLFRLELHLYSLAGITVSFGIIIDNTIVMTDHLRHQGNRKVFLAILAATLTTIGALSVIFFMGEATRVMLSDFAAVIIINLIVSLAVALFFIPSLIDKIKLPVRYNALVIRRKRRIVKLSNSYRNYIAFGRHYRWAFILVIILALGIPVFLLPSKYPKTDYYTTRVPELTEFQKFYNKTIGSSKFNQKLRPVLNKALGGSMRLFYEKVKSNIGYYFSMSDETPRTRLNVRIGLSQEGLTIENLNETCMGLENLIAPYSEVEMFTTSIYSASEAMVAITFLPEHDFTIFPYILKIRIEDYMNSIGSYHVQVSGVGRAFSNQVYSDYIQGSFSIEMRGYNFDQLEGYAEELKERLLLHERIKEVYILAERYSRKLYRNRIYLDDWYLAANNSDLSASFVEAMKYSRSDIPLSSFYINGVWAPVKLKSLQADNYDLWTVLNTSSSGARGRNLKMKDYTTITREVTDNRIARDNQQYVIYVSYDFIGSSELGTLITNRNIEETAAILPLGYSVGRAGYSRSWAEEKTNYMLIFLVIVIIYFVCAILLESFLQPLAVMVLIPVSFIGVFLTVSIFKVKPDEGAFASLILLSGLVVNAALYIINDYNNLTRRHLVMSRARTYLKAFNMKIVPIILTIVSTVVGLSPFLTAGRAERFWFPLAACTIGGLLFSLIGLVLYLPLFMKIGGNDLIIKPRIRNKTEGGTPMLSLNRLRRSKKK
ncbi:MAG: efflux RND transporter permease subunit, partial [Bacteroidales bacterium]|nr:efflux RND transporter permease subunit [Bacteroidales bacterium]